MKVNVKNSVGDYSYVILLTACVNPGGTIYTSLQDAEERGAQYKAALRWYLENTALRIVFVENTLTDFSSEFTGYINEGRLEYITFDGNNFDKSLGKGYGEAIIIETALKRSAFIKETDYLIKITGRLILSNLNKILKKHHPRSNDYVRVNTGLVNGHCYCLSSFFICPPVFLQNYFIPVKEKINDSKGYYFEHLLYYSLLRWLKDRHSHREFRMPFKFVGTSGSTNTQYSLERFSGFKVFRQYLLHRFSYYQNFYNFNTPEFNEDNN